MHADMAFLERHLPFKEDPTSYFKQAHSAIVFAVDYIPHPNPTDKSSELTLAKYAQGEDYHNSLKKIMLHLIEQFKLDFPDEYFECFTDSSPIMERDLAYQAGLGWFGKNSMLIDQKKGSFFFLAEIFTSLKLDVATTLHPDRCGKCTRCIDACPTDAIVEGRKIDSNKCISYLTIEAKSPATENLRHGIGEWFFGCDICQNVCPWNEKASAKKL